MEVSTCPECRRLEEQIIQLQAQVKQLQQQLEDAQRAGKRQAAPFSKGTPKQTPKRPGRKPGAAYGRKAHRQPPAPEQIDEVHEAALPSACPACGGPVEETAVAGQYQVEIPRRPIHRQFNVHIGQCRQCHKRVQGRHPLQTSDALGAAAAQLGPDAQAAIVDLNKHKGLSHPKVANCLQTLFGITVTASGVTHVLGRAARRCQPVYQELVQTLPTTAWIVPDETGWRVGGQSAWLHALVGPTQTVYVIDPTRSGDVAEKLLGASYDGVMIHDGWSAYDRFDTLHQQCLQHVIRRCHDMRKAATGETEQFPRQVQDLFTKALDLRDRYVEGQVSEHGLLIARSRLIHQLDALVETRQTDPANLRLAGHLQRHFPDWFTFLFQPELDATNWRAELAIRFGVILRKVWGGNRTWCGAQVQSVLMSIWRTCWQRGVSPLDFLSSLLRGPVVPLPLPP